MFSHVAGLQIATVSCSLLTTVINDATAGNHHCRRRRWRGRSATTFCANSDRPLSKATAAPAVATPADKRASPPTPEVVSQTLSIPQQLASPPPSPEAITPPAKRTRKRRNEVELLRGLGEEGELLLSPISCAASPPSLSPLSFSPSSPLRLQSSSSALPPPTALPSLSPPAPLYLEPASPTSNSPAPPASDLPAPPTFPALPPLAVEPPQEAMPADTPSSSPPPSATPVPFDVQSFEVQSFDVRSFSRFGH